MRHENTYKRDCSAKFLRNDGAMEVTGAKTIFHRSENKYDIRYVKYLGNRKAYSEVVASSLYGNAEIEKLECVGHV